MAHETASEAGGAVATPTNKSRQNHGSETLASLLAAGRRFKTSMLLLAPGVGVKLWPILLLPVLLRPLYFSPARLLSCAAVFLSASILVWWQAVPDLWGPHSGILAYAAQWQYNDGAFRLLQELCRLLFAGTGFAGDRWVQPVTRAVVGLALTAWIAWQAREPIRGEGDLFRRCLAIAGALFLLSPTQFPWYYTWLVPFLVVSPHMALRAYTALLPLYYVHLRHPAILWLEHGPI